MNRSLNEIALNGGTVPMPRPRWAARVGIPACLILAIAAVLGSSLRESFRPITPVEATPVVELSAKTQPAASVAPGGDKAALVQAAGWIEPDPYPIAVAALDSGTVAEVAVHEGDDVTAGDVLVRLVDADARLALDRAETDSKAVEASWRLNTTNERAVATTMARVDETSAAIALASAEREALTARASEAERTWQRYRSLADSGAASDEDYLAAETGWQVARATLEAAESRLGIARAQHAMAVADARAAAEVAEHRIEEARALGLARIRVEEAALRLGRMELRAPVSGKVMRRLAAPGSRLMMDTDAPDAALALLLYDPARLQVRADIPLADAARVGVGTPAEITVELLPGQTFSGVVTRVVGEADIQKNTLQVKVRLDDPAPQLRPEMLARVRFLQQSTAGNTLSGALAVFVPGDAVRDGMAFVVGGFDGAEGVAEVRRVTLSGAEHNGWLEVSDGLRPGDLVITKAPEDLADGARVRIAAHAEVR